MCFPWRPGRRPDRPLRRLSRGRSPRRCRRALVDVDRAIGDPFERTRATAAPGRRRRRPRPCRARGSPAHHPDPGAAGGVRREPAPRHVDCDPEPAVAHRAAAELDVAGPATATARPGVRFPGWSDDSMQSWSTTRPDRTSIASAAYRPAGAVPRTISARRTTSPLIFTTGPASPSIVAPSTPVSSSARSMTTGPRWIPRTAIFAPPVGAGRPRRDRRPGPPRGARRSRGVRRRAPASTTAAARRSPARSRRPGADPRRERAVAPSTRGPRWPSTSTNHLPTEPPPRRRPRACRPGRDDGDRRGSAPSRAAASPR